MNKTAIKNFATWARRKLISEITYKAGLIGINEKGVSQPLSISTDNIQFFDIGTGKPTEISDHEIKQRDALVSKIREKESTSDYKTAFRFIIEEVAYTWFNRLIAIRFMEVNDYLPSRIRVLSSTTQGKAEPDMVTTPFETDMVFSAYETDRIMQLKHENELDELFRILFIKQCNKLNEVLPELFEKTADYTELLLNISFTDSDGIVSHLINDIDENDFTEAVEIIGWMYQYYNIEPKTDVFSRPSSSKIMKEEIPAATQLFTPDWIVRYMVENSLGRLWIEGHPNKLLKSEWKYYLDEANQEESVKVELEKIRAEYKKLNPEEIKIIDPCMGSGHILVYAFEVLMQIYESQGYTQRDAAVKIVENNLFGLDIDDRAWQLAYFAIMMKARKYDRRFLTREIKPKVYSIKESNYINRLHIQYYGNSMQLTKRNKAIKQIEYLIDIFNDAKEYGSILNIDTCDWDILHEFTNDFNEGGQLTIDSIGQEATRKHLNELIVIAEIMAYKYEVVITNPPYMGSRKGMNPKLKNFVEKKYKDAKSDLYTCFIEKCLDYSKSNKYVAMITMHSFMFTDDYKELRAKLIESHAFINLAHLGADAFEEISGEVVQTAAFIIGKNFSKFYIGKFARLVDLQCDEKAMNLQNSELHYNVSSTIFSNIKATPVSYWLSETVRNSFNIGVPFEDYGKPRAGITTGENDRFLRMWHEVSTDKVGLNYKSVEEFHNSKKLYIPYNKGGEQIKWYGNNDYLIMFDEYNYNVLANQGNHLPSKQYYCMECMTWSDISGRSFAARYCSGGFVFDVKGSSGFPKKENLLFSMAFLNSKLTPMYIDSLNPTTTTQVGDLKRLPIIPPSSSDKEEIQTLAEECIKISKENWDSFETSWDFLKNPLLDGSPTLEIAFKHWEVKRRNAFLSLKSFEEQINQIYIDIYGLNDEMTKFIDESDIKLRKSDQNTDIRTLILYAVGCMFGRYSLDLDGLVYAGGDWDDSKYQKFIPDKDNCIPITDEEYFSDDIGGRFVDFVKCVFGAESLDENLEFIAKALGNKGDTSREIIRNYFVKDFYKDHVKTYQKRPIYWLYDSGKQDGFKALVYMHRYTADTTGIVRVDYLHKIQKTYMSEISRMKDMSENSNNAREVAQAEKRKEKLIKQLKETKEYDEKIAHLALCRIEIDLDDGVKVNYEKVQTGQDGKKLEILAKI